MIKDRRTGSYLAEGESVEFGSGRTKKETKIHVIIRLSS